MPYFLSKNRLTDRCQGPGRMVEYVRGLHYLPFYLRPLSNDTNEMNISPLGKLVVSKESVTKGWVIIT